MMDINSVVASAQCSIEKKDLEVALRIIQPKAPKIVCEIGMWKGLSAEVWIKAFDPVALVTIEKDKQLDGTVIATHDRYHYLFETDSNLESTRDKVKELLPEPIDFLFIDAGHNYNEARRDWELYSPLMSPTGIVAFHDVKYIQTNCQVNVLWEQLKRKYYYVEINIGTGSTGFGILFMDSPELSVANKSWNI